MKIVRVVFPSSTNEVKTVRVATTNRQRDTETTKWWMMRRQDKKSR